MENEAVSWSQGYISDVAYGDHFCAEISPVHLNYIAALTGCEVRSLREEFTYCELGCGPGQTVNILAASNPEGRFFACDFNPAHVVAARKLSKAAGLTNLTVLERSFEEMVDEDLPDFDFVVLHGVWSWISAENRHHVVEFLYKKLKPGGLAYVSYNALPGWAPVAPIQRMMRAIAETLPGGSLARVPHSLDFLRSLRDVKAEYFSAAGAAGPFLDALGAQDVNYLAHEYLNQSWNPFYSTDVAKEMSAAKLCFAGSATAIENHHVLMMSKPMVDFLGRAPSREVAQLVQDFLINQRFRRDVFVRGTPVPDRPNLDTIVFGLLRPAADIVFKLRGPLAEFSFGGDAVRAVTQALDDDPKTLAAVSACAGPSKFSAMQLAQAAMTLVASGQAMIFSVPGPRSAAPVQGRGIHVPLAMNKAILDENFTAPQRATLASPRAGNGVKFELLSRVFLKAVADGEGDDMAGIWESLARHGVSLTRDGRKIEDRKVGIEDLKARFQRFEEKTLPVFRYLGIVEPA